MKFQDKEQYRSELRNIDWDFTGDAGQSGFATYHWYPARYVPQLPGILINYFSKPGEIVLDPFSGSGTTLLEAFKFGRRALGIDLNPNAVLITRSKTTQYDQQSFLDYKIRVLAATENRLIEVRGSRKTESALLESIPNCQENTKWYHNSTLIELSAIWSALLQYSESHYLPVGQAAFSSILLPSCSQAKHWGWICDNVKPRELLRRNSLTMFRAKLIEYESCALQLDAEAKDLQEERVDISQIKVVEGDCSKILSGYSSESFDLVVTSPPYYNVTDYIKSQRLSNLWFSVDTTNLKRAEIGARYKRGRQKALDDYLVQMDHAMRNIARVLKPGRFCCIVLGESPQHKSYLTEFEELCLSSGLELWDSISRTVSSSRRFVASVKREKIFIMKKLRHDSA